MSDARAHKQVITAAFAGGENEPWGDGMTDSQQIRTIRFRRLSRSRGALSCRLSVPCNTWRNLAL